ncbi:HAMP domain-containing methyl-accepting chemotaxis protein [Paenibacillus xerothermodurans]|uniref:HAMP domain-containing methyl-accepting chemotaxis protein n=1 Tax=Paenibacillus xerothermodurans TaxID=1977292 RepID=UPI001FB1DA6A|nr:methyl-accepting chemotaxis protein [Paenibacillus xerothermodurans]
MMNVKTKLFVGFGTLMFLMFTLAGIGINRLSTIDESMKEIYSNRYKKVQMTSALREHTSKQARHVANLLLIDDTAASARNLEEIRTELGKVSQYLARFEAENKGGVEQPLASDIITRGKRYLDYNNDLISLYVAGKKAEANALRTGVGVEAQEEFLDSITAMTLYQEDAMTQALRQAENENSTTYRYTVLMTITSLLCGVAIMFWLVVSITRGLGLLSMVMHHFGNRQGTGLYRVPIQTTDEFGGIASTFNEIAEELEEISANERQLGQLNADQAWLQTNIAHVSTQLQSIQRLDAMAETFISELCRIIGAQNGAMYIAKQEGLATSLTLQGTYARNASEAMQEVVPGDGLIGQCASDGKPITLTNVGLIIWAFALHLARSLRYRWLCERLPIWTKSLPCSKCPPSSR